jgi:hypothetical protein
MLILFIFNSVHGYMPSPISHILYSNYLVASSSELVEYIMLVVNSSSKVTSPLGYQSFTTSADA